MSWGWELRDFQVQEAGILGDVGFIYLFILMWTILKSLLNLLQQCFCFSVFLAPSHVGSELSAQGLNPYIPSGVEGKIITTGQPGKPLGDVL